MFTKFLEEALHKRPSKSWSHLGLHLHCLWYILGPRVANPDVIGRLFLFVLAPPTFFEYQTFLMKEGISPHALDTGQFFPMMFSVVCIRHDKIVVRSDGVHPYSVKLSHFFSIVYCCSLPALAKKLLKQSSFYFLHSHVDVVKYMTDQKISYLCTKNFFLKNSATCAQSANCFCLNSIALLQQRVAGFTENSDVGRICLRLRHARAHFPRFTTFKKLECWTKSAFEVGRWSIDSSFIARWSSATVTTLNVSTPAPLHA